MKQERQPISYPTFVTLACRLTLGALMLQYGVRLAADYTVTVQRLRAGFVETWLPIDLVTAVAYLIPAWQIAVGASLVLGLWYRWGLTALAALLCLMTFGLAVQGDGEGVARNLIYLLVVFFAYRNAESNPFSLDALRAR